MRLGHALNKCILSGLSVQCLSEQGLLAEIVPRVSKNGYPPISTFYQPEFETCLLDGLRRFSCVEVRFQYTLETLEQYTDGLVVSIRTPTGALEQLHCDYLLACDGAKSTVRRLLNIPMRGNSFAQKWLVIDTVSQEAPPAVVQIFCNPRRPAVSIAAPRNGRRWEFMLLPGESEQQALEPATVSTLLWQTGAPLSTQVIRRAVYAFHALNAKSYAQGRVFLLGDAAHMMPPFGGQGLNSGLRDACNLAWKIALVLQQRANPRLLDSYHEERSQHAASMVAFASLSGTLFMSTNRAFALGRNRVIQLLGALPFTCRYLMEMRVKPQAKYRAGFFLWRIMGKDVENYIQKEGLRFFKSRKKGMVGTLLPQPEVIIGDGSRVLLDEVLGSGFALLRRHSNAQEAFTTIRTDFWERLGTRFVCIQTGDAPGKTAGSPSLPITIVQAPDMHLPGVDEDYFVVVRPDRFILGIFKEEEANAFVSALQALLPCTDWLPLQLPSRYHRRPGHQ